MLIIASLATMIAASSVLAATPSTITIHATDTQVTWSDGILGGSNPNDRTTCVYGVSCDTLHLVIAPGDYTGKSLLVEIDWLNPGSDYDMYCFENVVEGPVVGSSTNGAPENTEQVPISLNGVVSSPRTIAIQVVAWAAAPEPMSGVVKVQTAPAARTAIFQNSTDITFSPNVTMYAPGTGRDCEPSIRVDVRGNCYIGGIRGVPGGVDMWRFDLDPTSGTYDPQMRQPFYLGQPDSFAPSDSVGGKDGGGDIDLATGFPDNGTDVPVLSEISLALANISSATSTDRGNNFAHNMAASSVPSDDRQWMEAQGPDTVYMMYRGVAPGTSLFCQRSTDHGLNYSPPTVVSPTGTTPGYIDVDHSNGYVYIAHLSSTSMLVSVSRDAGQTWTTHTVDNSTSHHNLFDVVKVGDDGTVYAVWSDKSSIHMAHSTDHGDSWSPPVTVSGSESQSALFPWLEAGSAGRVMVVWFGSATPNNTDACDWRVYAAFTSDATAQNPHVKIVQVSDHVVHASNISLGGLGVDTPATPQPNRNLCDYFQVAIDPLGAAVIAFTDDHNDFDGNTYASRQLSGPSLYASANGGTGVLAGESPIPLPTPNPGDPQVTDFLHDAGASLQPDPNDNPYDILSIRYGCAVVNAAVQLDVKMKVSGLAPVPPNTFWRSLFAANAPGGTPDRGDDFYLQATTDGSGTPSYTFGQAVRDSNGSYSYNPLGTADAGSMDTGTNTVEVALTLGRLDPYVTHGPGIRAGSTLCGLRGATGTSNANEIHDVTRGAGPMTVCSEVLAVDPPGGVTEFGLSAPRPNPARSGTAFNLYLPRTAWVELGVFDASGRRVRSVQAGLLPAGTTQIRWDGRTDTGHPAPTGAYFVRMLASGQSIRQRLVLVR
jgi:hypothetical protein